MTRLTTHFFLSEFTTSRTAILQGIKNDPNEHQTKNLAALALVLEDLRRRVGDRPITITSGFRCPALNKAVGGTTHSAHTSGHAADIICPGYGTPLELCHLIAKSDMTFDQLIHEGTWVHLAIPISPTRPPRRSVLTAHFNLGSVRYTPGLSQLPKGGS